MRASARKDHSIPLELFEWDTHEAFYEENLRLAKCNIRLFDLKSIS